MNPSVYLVKFLLLFSFLTCLVVRAAPPEYPVTGTIEVVQTAGGNSAESLTLSLSPASSPGVGINFALQNRADHYPIFSSPPEEGILLTSIAQNGRDHTEVGGPDGIRYATCATGLNQNGHFISSFAVPSGGELNINPAFGYFHYSQWLGAFTNIDSSAGSPLILIHASLGITLGPGSTIVDESETGVTTVNLTQLDSSSSSQGILLVNAVGNRDNYALSRAEANGTFTVFCKDNSETSTTNEQGGIAFVYLPLSKTGSQGLVALGRIRADATADISNGDFTLTRPIAAESRWHLTVPGYSADSGTLLISPEGGGATNRDNIFSYEWDPAAAHWVIDSRDNPNLGLSSGLDDEIMFSFAFFSSEPNLVTTLDDENNPQATDGTGISLREAIRDAETGDRIRFAQNLTGGTISVSSPLLVSKNLTIAGPGLTIDRTRDHSLIQTTREDSDLTLIGLHLSSQLGAGRATTPLISANNHLTLEQCEVRGEGREDATAISISNGTLKFQNCRFLNNGRNTFNRSGGGALRIQSEATATITDCLFEGNNSYTAGVISNQGTLSVDRSTFSGNSGSKGGAIFNRGVATFSNCTFTGNAGDTPFTASGKGGAIYNRSDGTLTLFHCTVVGNNTLEAGGGIFNEGTLTLAHTVLADNTLNNGTPNDLVQDDGTTTATAPIMIEATDAPIIETSPDFLRIINGAGLRPLGDFGGLTPTMPPLPHSPLIDQASSSASTSDQRGLPRDSSPDIGAAELEQIQITTTTDELDHPASNGNGISLREAIRDASPAAHLTFAPSLSGETFPVDGQSSIGARLVIDRPLIIDGSSVSQNPLIDGGRFLILRTGGTGPIALIGLDFTSTSGGFVAGIDNQCANLLIDQCSFRNCEATHPGLSVGAILNDSLKNITLQNSTFIGNQGRTGAVHNNGGIMTISNCTFVDNTASVHGGAIYNGSGTTSLVHCTIIGNTAPADQGGGLSNRTNRTNRTITCRNSLITDNEGGDVQDFDTDLPIISAGGNCVVTGNAIAGFNAIGDINRAADSLLHPLADFGGRTLIRLPKSDAGLDDLAKDPASPPSGQRGKPRIWDIDRGAVENLTDQDLISYWTQDWDGDGLTYGLEQAIGSDPYSPDATTTRNLQITDLNTLTFWQSANALPQTSWRLSRSTDLISFETIFSLGTATDADQEVSFTERGDPETKAFYRLEAIFNP